MKSKDLAQVKRAIARFKKRHISNERVIDALLKYYKNNLLDKESIILIDNEIKKLENK